MFHLLNFQKIINDYVKKDMLVGSSAVPKVF